MQCPYCRATYNRLAPDNTLYFHECPPLSLPEYKAKFPAFLGDTPPLTERPVKLREGRDLPKPIHNFSAIGEG